MVCVHRHGSGQLPADDQRGALDGTTMEAHTGGTSGDLIYDIQHPLLMKYGNATATDPAADDPFYDTTKPLINLTSSTNTSWVWDATTKFRDPLYINRTAGWGFSRQTLGPNSKTYDIKQDAETGEPALGLKVATFQSAGVWKAENVVLIAEFRREAGITSVSMTGAKYRSNANWLLQAVLRRSTDNKNFYNLWAETSPASLATWTSWTHNSVSVSPTSPLLQLVFSGGYAAADSAYAAFEGLTCTVAFDSNKVPAVAFLGEQDNYPMDITVENLTNGDSITLNAQLLLNKTFELDGETRVASYDGANAYGAVTVDDPGRSDLIRLVGNTTNQIRISGTDMGTIEVDLHYYTRRL